MLDEEEEEEDGQTDTCSSGAAPYICIFGSERADIDGMSLGVCLGTRTMQFVGKKVGPAERFGATWREY